MLIILLRFLLLLICCSHTCAQEVLISNTLIIFIQWHSVRAAAAALEFRCCLQMDSFSWPQTTNAIIWKSNNSRNAVPKTNHTNLHDKMVFRCCCLLVVDDFFLWRINGECAIIWTKKVDEYQFIYKRLNGLVTYGFHMKNANRIPCGRKY